MPFAAAWMDLKIIILNERNIEKKKKAKYIMVALICGTLNTTEVFISMKKKQTHRHRGLICDCQWVQEVGGWADWGVWDYLMQANTDGIDKQ